VSWRCTITDPTSGREVYVRADYPYGYVVAVPTTGKLTSAIESGHVARVAANALVVESDVSIATVDDEVYLKQNFGPVEAFVSIRFDRQHRDIGASFEKFEATVKKYKKATRKKGT
jgi:hypothetical protein